MYYMALVSHVDSCVGKILEVLKRTGRDENTIVIFTSDHGEYLGDHGRIQKGIPGHDCIIRGSFIMRYPKRIHAGSVINEMVEAMDVVPTILDYCGVQVPRAVQGGSIKPLIEDMAEVPHDDILVEWFEPFGHRVSMVRTAEYKCSCDSKGNEILYDISDDPYELEDVSQDERYKAILAEMRKRLIIRMNDSAYNCCDKTAEY